MGLGVYIDNLGILYKYQGKMAKAEKNHQQALEGKREGIRRLPYIHTLNNSGVLPKA